MRRPAVLWLLAAVYLVLGLMVLLLAVAAGSGAITWDVKGFLLTGWRLLLFSGALAAVALVALLSAYGLWMGKRWAPLLSMCFWGAAGGLALLTDRSVEGAGEPLRTYLLYMMLIPGASTAALLYGLPYVRSYFTGDR